jgi:Flp pilus assembly protein TadG
VLSSKTNPTRQLLWKRLIQFLKSRDGAQIVELAVSLPLLTVIFVGTYDFGQAFNLKQKLAGAAREGARFAALQSASDLTSSSTVCGTAQNPGPPASVCAVRDVVDNYLVSAAVNDCGLGSATGSSNAGWSWTFTTPCAAGNLTLTVNRAVTYTTSNNKVMEGSQVTLSYPYQWHFSRVIKLVAPTANYAGVTNIPGAAAMQNLY